MLNVVVLTVKVEGLIEPPLALMASTKACYKLGLTGTAAYPRVEKKFRYVTLTNRSRMYVFDERTKCSAFV